MPSIIQKLEDYTLNKIKLLPQELEDYIYSFIKDDYSIKLRLLKDTYNLHNSFKIFRNYGYEKYILDVFYDVFPTDNTSFPLFLCECEGFIEDRSNYAIVNYILLKRIKEIEEKNNDYEAVYKIYRNYIILSNKMLKKNKVKKTSYYDFHGYYDMN
jgi:hypothetical protein